MNFHVGEAVSPSTMFSDPPRSWYGDQNEGCSKKLIRAIVGIKWVKNLINVGFRRQKRAQISLRKYEEVYLVRQSECMDAG